MAGWFPGWPGPIYQGGRAGIGMPHLPSLPAHPGGPAAASVSPLSGLAAYGVPVALTQGGHGCLQAATAAGEGEGTCFMLPPELPGMPIMPGPPDGLMTGGPQGGGLFRAVPPVLPFNATNQVRQMQQQAGGAQ